MISVTKKAEKSQAIPYAVIKALQIQTLKTKSMGQKQFKNF